jgi:hypothetical protein
VAFHFFDKHSTEKKLLLLLLLLLLLQPAPPLVATIKAEKQLNPTTSTSTP